MDPWAQLVSTTDIDSDPIAIKKQKFIIGRAQGTDLCFSNNKLVSGLHCFIERDASGNIWLQDTSTNGTLLNQKTKVTGQRVPLAHGDEIFIVCRKAEADLNLSFLFQVIEDLHREQLESTDEGSIEIDQMQPYEEDFSESLESRCIESNQRKNEDLKRQRPSSSSKGDDSDNEPMTKKPKCHTNSGAINDEADSSSAKSEEKKQQDKVKLEIENDVSDSKMNKEETPKAQQSADPRSVDPKSVDPKSVDPKSVDPKPADGQSTSAVQSGIPEKSDELLSFMENELICSICQDILHNSVSLQPCLHTFCAGCYSDWMNKSKSCPWCRRQVKFISKNHKTNNIVEAYLKAHPDKRRSDDDLKELDEKNRFTKEIMEPLDPENPIEYDVDDEGDEEEEEEEEGSQNDFAPLPPPPPQYPFYPPVQNVFPNYVYPVPLNVIRPAKTVCRQCPEYLDQYPVINEVSPRAASGSLPVGACACGGACAPGACALGGTSVASTSNAKSFPVPPKFTCTANQNHVMCQCCWEPMPHRKWERNALNPIPPQECVICYKPFCHLYWGCRATCDGCLNKFEETVFQSQVLDGIVLKNKFESSGLKTYLSARGLLVHDFFKMCVHRLKTGTYTCSGQDLILHPDSAVCYTCALDKFSELAYQFRKDIQDDMPDHFKHRTNCYWGRNCSTQRNNEGHAQRFNHICEASRTDVRH